MSSQDKDYQEQMDQQISRLLTFFWISSFVVGLLGVLLVLFYRHYIGTDISIAADVWGSFGDFLGGSLGPVIAFISLLALLFALIIQVRALKIATQELRLTRDEIELTKNIFIAQQTTLASQLEIAKIKEARDAVYQLIRSIDEELEKLVATEIRVLRIDAIPIGQCYDELSPYYYAAPTYQELNVTTNRGDNRWQSKILLEKTANLLVLLGAGMMFFGRLEMQKKGSNLMLRTNHLQDRY